MGDSKHLKSAAQINPDEDFLPALLDAYKNNKTTRAVCKEKNWRLSAFRRHFNQLIDKRPEFKPFALCETTAELKKKGLWKEKTYSPRISMATDAAMDKALLALQELQKQKLL
jgi:hypothetical protein